jgi:SP family general alpha glucoside:H+ symporter-like MFS transporter
MTAIVAKVGSSPTNEDTVMTHGARIASEAEKNMTLRQALQRHRKAVLWSLLATTSIIMEGFDLALITGFYAYPAFQVGLISHV